MTIHWPYPRVLAHRGGGSLAPENTLAALAAGYAHGFRAVEFDVMLTGDGVPVLMHDPEFGRTVAGKGAVSATAAADLLKRDAGAWFGSAFAGVTVPGYDAVLDYCLSHGVFMNVEIKPAPGFEAETGRVVAAVTAQRLSQEDRIPVLFSSFSTEALAAARATAPHLPRGHLFDKIPPNWRECVGQLECRTLHCHHRNVSAAFASAVHDAGLGLFCYTVNDLARALELAQLGIDAFCTDRIDLIPADFFETQAQGA